MNELKHDWSFDQVESIFKKPILDLIFEAAAIHRKHFEPGQVQVSSLISVKTGGCPENCSYCPQSAHYDTKIDKHGLMPLDEVKNLAQQARANGSSRVCLGAAWRKVPEGEQFDRVLEMVETINDMGMEVCCTLGMLNSQQAQRLKQAGLYAYNHNIDTSEEYYSSIISTRDFKDRIETLGHVRKAKLTMCSGGIIGMGESEEDRIRMLVTLSNFTPHPESVPINTLVAVEGTPLEKQQEASIWELVRMIATARIIMPKSFVRLSAGRLNRSAQDQALCFLAGANSIFSGEKLLTTANPTNDKDEQLFQLLGLKKTQPFEGMYV